MIPEAAGLDRYTSTRGSQGLQGIYMLGRFPGCTRPSIRRSHSNTTTVAGAPRSHPWPHLETKGWSLHPKTVPRGHPSHWRLQQVFLRAFATSGEIETPRNFVFKPTSYNNHVAATGESNGCDYTRSRARVHLLRSPGEWGWTHSRNADDRVDSNPASQWSKSMDAPANGTSNNS